MKVGTVLQPDDDGAAFAVAFPRDSDRMITPEELRRAVQAIPVPPAWMRTAKLSARHDAGESSPQVYMEITRRDDMGADLNAPVTARGGVVTASYALVPLVRAGDVVVHYDSRREAIIGVSAVSGPAVTSPVYWVARGSYARRAGERPRWLSGIRVPLGDYRELAEPVALSAIRARKDELFRIRDRLQQEAAGKAIYFPWIPYRDTLRTFQSYLVKLPAEVIALFPAISAAVREAETSALNVGPPSPADQAEDAVEQAAGKLARRRKGRGQGFQPDQEVKVAVEAYAMNAATSFYSGDWDVEDVHSAESYDLICRQGSAVKHVEVKGTTTDGQEVILTRKEVDHARDHEDTALFILSDIKVSRTDDGAIEASGGILRICDPWKVDQGTLLPIGYRYQRPPANFEANWIDESRIAISISPPEDGQPGRAH